MSRLLCVAICVLLLSNLKSGHGFDLLHLQDGEEEGGCGDGMTLIGQFFNCTKPRMEPYRIDEDWLVPGYTMNQGILSYLTTYCSMILPAGVHCLEAKLSACDVNTRKFVLDDARGAGGFCDGRSVSAAVTSLLTSLPEASPRSVESCPDVDTGSCYDVISDQLYTKDVFYLQARELAPYVQRTFQQVFQCLVSKYRAQRAQCEPWQLNLLWRHSRTFLPNPLGFSLTPQLLQPLNP